MTRARSSARAMFASTGYFIESECVRGVPFPGDHMWWRVPVLQNAWNQFLAYMSPGVYGSQLVFKFCRRDGC